MIIPLGYREFMQLKESRLGGHAESKMFIKNVISGDEINLEETDFARGLRKFLLPPSRNATD